MSVNWIRRASWSQGDSPMPDDGLGLTKLQLAFRTKQEHRGNAHGDEKISLASYRPGFGRLRPALARSLAELSPRASRGHFRQTDHRAVAHFANEPEERPKLHIGQTSPGPRHLPSVCWPNWATRLVVENSLLSLLFLLFRSCYVGKKSLFHGLFCRLQICTPLYRDLQGLPAQHGTSNPGQTNPRCGCVADWVKG